jgi:hypothetical protein
MGHGEVFDVKPLPECRSQIDAAGAAAASARSAASLGSETDAVEQSDLFGHKR